MNIGLYAIICARNLWLRWRGLDPQMYLIRRLQKQGVDLEAPRDVVLFFYVSDRQAAEGLVQVLIQNDLRAPMIAPSRGGKWRVQAFAPTQRSLNNLEIDYVKYDDFARRFGGEFDGWECAIQSQ